MDLTPREQKLLEYAMSMAARQIDTAMENAATEIDALYDRRIADVENALCEIDEGGNGDE